MDLRFDRSEIFRKSALGERHDYEMPPDPMLLGYGKSCDRILIENIGDMPLCRTWQDAIGLVKYFDENLQMHFQVYTWENTKDLGNVLRQEVIPDDKNFYVLLPSIEELPDEIFLRNEEDVNVDPDGPELLLMEDIIPQTFPAQMEVTLGKAV